MESIEEIVVFTVHNYIRELVGGMVYLALTCILILLGLVLFLASVTNSNTLLGDPSKRDKSKLGEIEYRRTRKILRVVLGVIGFTLVVYNILGLMA